MSDKRQTVLAFLSLAGCFASPWAVAVAENFAEQLVGAAIERTAAKVRYDDSYFYIPYPNGDVPDNLGVCTDVVIRTYRALGVDLQQLVHEDMADNFELYPSRRIWSLTEPDTNIDHRRVPNLQIFFSRYGKALPISDNPDDYAAGDIVTWRMRGNRPHIGIITDLYAPSDGTPLIVHNIGRGPVLDNILFRYPISGHYQYAPVPYANSKPRTESQPLIDSAELFQRSGDGYTLNEALLKKMFPEETSGIRQNVE